MDKNQRSVGVRLTFARPGESMGCCEKQCGSNNCAFSVVRGQCPGITNENVPEGSDLLAVHCESIQVHDRERSRASFLKKVGILTSPRTSAA